MRVKLAPLGPSLISRTRGEAIRCEILTAVGDTSVIVLDFEGVSRASYSFVDELVGELSTMSNDGAVRSRVEVVGASGTVGRHVEACLSRRLRPAESALS